MLQRLPAGFQVCPYFGMSRRLLLYLPHFFRAEQPEAVIL